MSQVAAELVQGAACNHGARVLHRDYETRSQATLKKIGTYRYASDLHDRCSAAASRWTTVRCSCGRPAIRRRSSSRRRPIRHGSLLPTARTLRMQSNATSAPSFWLAHVPYREAALHPGNGVGRGIAGPIEPAAIALELSNRKDAAGERLMHQTSKPRRPHKDENPDGIYWFEDQERLDRLVRILQARCRSGARAL